jgi:hypothetical protein
MTSTMPKAADITDEAFLAAIDEVARRRSEPGRPWTIGASRWDIACVLAGHPELVGTATGTQDWPNVPPKVVRAKAKRLIARRLIDGCSCGCRGDFIRTDEPGATTP